MMQRGVGVLQREEKPAAQRRPSLMAPAADGPAAEHRRHLGRQHSKQGLGLRQRNRCGAEVFAGDDRTSKQGQTSAALEHRALRVLTLASEGAPRVHGQVVVGQTVGLEHAAEVAHVEADVGWNAEGGGLVLVAVHHEPAGCTVLRHGPDHGPWASSLPPLTVKAKCKRRGGRSGGRAWRVNSSPSKAWTAPSALSTSSKTSTSSSTTASASASSGTTARENHAAQHHLGPEAGRRRRRLRPRAPHRLPDPDSGPRKRPDHRRGTLPQGTAVPGTGGRDRRHRGADG